AGVPDRGDRLRRPGRPREPRRQAQGRGTELRAPRRPRHAPAHDVSRQDPQPRRGGARMSVRELPPVIEPGHTFGTVTDKISAVVLTRPTPRAWFVGFAI